MTKLLVLSALLLLPSISAADSFDLRGVNFKSGHPTRGEPLEAAVVGPGEIDGLKTTAEALRNYPQLHIEIAGHADKTECGSSNECQNLALRRAVSVYRKLLDFGASPKQIVALREYGVNFPIASSPSESSINSRTELNIYSEP